MTNIQKVVVAALSLVAVTIIGMLVCSVAFFFLGPVFEQSSSDVGAVAQQVPLAAPEETVLSTTTPTQQQPTQTVDATATADPTATSTRVVTVTVPPTPTPTRASCENEVNNFEASGLISNQEVKDYLRRTLPNEHLDNCREIRYVPLAAAAHGTAISGSFIPVYREIFVYSNPTSLRGVDDLLNTLVHEIGHNVHYNIRRDSFDLDVTWAALHRESFKSAGDTGLGFVSTYAQTNKFEDFAETYMAYVRAPEVLIYYNPDKYEFMKQEIFNGLEYIP